MGQRVGGLLALGQEVGIELLETVSGPQQGKDLTLDLSEEGQQVTMLRSPGTQPLEG
jgi:hypothetical protein